MKKRTVFFIIFSLMFILASPSFGQEFSSKPIKKLESRHQVIAVQFSPLGKYLAIAFKNEVQLLDAQTFYQVRSIKPKFSISHISISPDERLLAFSSYYGEKSIRIWDAETNNQIRELSRAQRRNADIRSVAFSPDGNFIASVDGNLLQLWSGKTWGFIRQLNPRGIVYSIAFRFDGKVLASGSKDAHVWIWDVDKGSLIKQTPSVYEGTIRSIAFSPDGMLVAFCSDESVWLWDVGTNEPEKLFEHEGIVHAVAFSPDGNFLASGSEDRTVRIWNVTKSAQEQILKEHRKPVLAVAFRPDSQILASGGMDGKVFLWERKAPKAEILKAEILRVLANPRMLIANGKSTSTVTVTVLDAEGNKFKGENVTINISQGTGKIGEVTDNKNGTYTATYTAGTISGEVLLTVKTGRGLTSVVDLKLIVGDVSKTRSLITASRQELSANGEDATTITVTLVDTHGGPVSDKRTTIVVSGKGNLFTPRYATTDASGKVAFTLKSTEAGEKSVTALDVTDGIKLANSVKIIFTPVIAKTPLTDKPPQIVLLSPPELQKYPNLPYKTTKVPLQIVGLATDDKGIIEVTINGLRVTLTSATEEEKNRAGITGNATIKFRTEIPLSFGTNQISIQVTDDSEQPTIQKFNVILIDENPPVIEILEPSALSQSEEMKVEAEEETIYLVGSASDETDILKVTVDGKEAEMEEMTKGSSDGKQFWFRFFTAEIPLKGGINRVRIQATDSSENIGSKNITIIKKTPVLSIVEINVKTTGTDKWVKAENATVNNGERVDLLVTVRNTGKLNASGVTVIFGIDNPEILNIVETAQIKNIASQKQRSGILSFLIPRTFTGKSIELLMTAKDDKSFSIIKKRVTLEVKRRAPKITLTDSKFHDGGTAHSKGNQNNKIEQGEQIELHLTIKNEGDMSVEQVQLQLITTAKGVTLNKISLPEILSLQPSGKSQPFIFQLQIGFNFTPGPLPLIVTITQKDFPDVEIPMEFQVYPDGPPQVVVLSPALSSEDKVEVDVETLLLRVRVTDGKGVTELNLYHNDDYQHPLQPKSSARVPKQTERGVIPVASKEIYMWEIPLVVGYNKLEVIAKDTDNNKTNKTIRLFRKPPLYVPPSGETYAVIIGISKYESSDIQQLRYASADARVILEFFSSRQGNIKSDNTRWFLDNEPGHEATKENILSALGDWLPRAASHKMDTVILFYSGHGIIYQGDGYFVTYDADPERWSATALPMYEVQRKLGKIEAERIIVLVDTCHSAGVVKDALFTMRRGGEYNMEKLRRELAGTGRAVITSCDKNEQSLETDEYQHGLFTYFLWQGLLGKAETNGDGRIDLDEAYRYVYDNVTSTAAKLGSKQTPMKDAKVKGKLILSIVE